jgi:Protein of unknown function (DUF3515)
VSSLPSVCPIRRSLAAAARSVGPARRVLPALAVLAAGCGAGDVEVPVPRPPSPVVSLCRAFHDRLPRGLHGLERRETAPRSDLVAAWGSPAVAVRCGVPRPAGLRRLTAQLAVINGVSWLPQPPDRPVTFTAVGRHAYVEVTVPPRYSPPGDVLNELTGAIKATIPANSDATL